ncbi:hypothetical protein J6590_022790 [Homalodisca vitripennis]|nr:hypothetical protein J6590_022790 [Homalodisca vitripennis]
MEVASQFALFTRQLLHVTLYYSEGDGDLKCPTLLRGADVNAPDVDSACVDCTFRDSHFHWQDAGPLAEEAAAASRRYVTGRTKIPLSMGHVGGSRDQTGCGRIKHALETSHLALFMEC